MFNLETDLVLMSLVIFIPSLAALLLLFVPKGQEEWMRWISLFGTAITLVASIVMFIDYRAEVTGLHSAEPENGTLSARANYADLHRYDVKQEGLSNTDWVARRPWVERFRIDYYLGADGISMSLVLLTTVLSF